MSLDLKVLNCLLSVELVKVWVNISFLDLRRLRLFLFILLRGRIFGVLILFVWEFYTVLLLKVLRFAFSDHFLDYSFSDKFVIATNFLNLRPHLPVQSLSYLNDVGCFDIRIWTLVIDFILKVFLGVKDILFDGFDGSIFTK